MKQYDGQVVLLTGGFDPLHSGHLAMIREASKLGRVIIGLNSDEWLTRKKGKSFMKFSERFDLMNEMKSVMTVIGFDDSDNSACDAIMKAKQMFPDQKIIFANGGDRTDKNIPEMDRFKDDPQVEFVFGVGGDFKMNSSSTILQNWTVEKVERVWGHYSTYYKKQDGTTKLKRLTLEPGKSISMQYHNNRSELWFVEQGEGVAYTLDEETDEEIVDTAVSKHDVLVVDQGTWHRLENTGTEDLMIIEIQFGSSCEESDITRKP